jgi:hypothetical protein
MEADTGDSEYSVDGGPAFDHRYFIAQNGRRVNDG